MPRINLLPWRAEERKEKKLAFIVAILGATVAALVAAFGAYFVMNATIDGQLQRNERLKAAIKVLDKQIEEINSLESAKQKFIARMEIIEKLQRSRPEIVHVFDEIVKQIPEGVYLTSVKQTDKSLKFEGVAQSSTRVSAFMRNIDASDWLRNPSLDIIENKTGQNVGSSFIMTAEQVSTVSEDAQAEAVPAGKGKGKGKDQGKPISRNKKVASAGDSK
jgi:type IV pilus assembly protein PilN